MSLSKSLKKVAKVTWELEPELLLHPQIPKPMHGLAPRTVLGSKWWNETRKAAYEETDYHCKACGVWKRVAPGRGLLEAHEVYRIDYQKGRMAYARTVALCSYCHAFIHQGRLQALMERGEITQAHYVAVIQHGNRVLAEAGLKRGQADVGQVAEWGRWRLVVNRKHYKPVYPTYEDWLKAMEG